MKNLYLKYLLLLFSLNLTLDVSAQYFRKIGIEQGLVQPTVQAIYQDTLGRMWFGTREGVNVYDGRQILEFRPDIIEGSLSNSLYLMANEVDRIVGDKMGNVFLRADKVLIKYNIEKGTFHTLHSHIDALNSFRGNIWYTSSDSLYRYNADSGTQDFIRKLDLPEVTCLFFEDTQIWIGTVGGLYAVTDKDIRCVIPSTEIYGLYKSKRGRMWISTRNEGLYTIKRDGVLRKEPTGKGKVESNQIREVVEDDMQNIWFGTFDGLQVYNPYSDTYRIIRPENRQGALSHSSVYSLYRDRQGTIWMGTYYGGVNYINDTKDFFYYYEYNALRDDCLNHQFVGPMVEDSNKRLWICTDGGGVNCLDRRTGKFTYYTASSTQSILHNNVKAIAYDEKRECLYIGTHLGGLSRFDIKKHTFHNYLTVNGREGPADKIYHIQLKNDRLYVSTNNGLWVLNPDTDIFESLLTVSPILTFCVDSRGYIWMAKKNELLRMNLHGDLTPESVRLDSTDTECSMTKILESSSGEIYIATLGKGLKVYNYSTNSFTTYTKEHDDLLSNYCYNIMETSQNSIIITSDKGISILSVLRKFVESVERHKNGIFATTVDGGICECKDERIYIGGINGMISFIENDLYKDCEDDVNFYFSDLSVNNSRIQPNDDTGILKATLPFTPHLDLSSQQKNIDISFSVSDYTPKLRSRSYQYKLEGYDENWTFITNNELHYTNLSPNHYILRVRQVSNTPNIESPKEISIGITVRHPWYNTPLAWLCYFVLLSFLFFMFWRAYGKKREMLQSLENEKREKKLIEETNKIKLRFFTNISHEFRTPLTLIIGQIENLQQLEGLPLFINKRLSRIHRNAMHLKSLISELIDFRKQEQGFLKLKVEPVDVVDFAKNIFLLFEEYARKRHISYTFQPEEKNIELYLDPKQMQKVFFNLLSNAFNHTPEGGKITVTIKRLLQTIEITISDTGHGIPKEALTKIFERFYQVDDTNVKISLSAGSGIGLALTKGIVNEHKGQIEVESEVGKGSTFKVQLRLGNGHFSLEELNCEKKQNSMPFSDIYYPYEVMEELPESELDKYENIVVDDTKPSILIVEDDDEILGLLEDIFSPTYNVYKAVNGQEGFNKVSQIFPDLVLSDVMIPVMSGKELCYKMKNSMELCQIPVVLLTAQSSLEQMIDGYTFGADDYIAKPFNVKLLLARCNNLVKNRQMIRQFQLEKTPDSVQEGEQEGDGLSAPDKHWIEKATCIIKRNFDNPDFNMDQLAAELHLSRTKMFGYFKSILGTTPNDFALRLKLEEAARLLFNAPEYSISEISYKVGFSSPRYFSRCFKTYYNMTPLDYRKSGGKH